MLGEWGRVEERCGLEVVNDAAFAPRWALAHRVARRVSRRVARMVARRLARRVSRDVSKGV